MANKMRGELEIKLLDKTFVLKPDFNALCSMEEKSGLGLMGMANRVMEQNVSVKMLTAIIHCGIVGGGCSDYTFEQVGSMVVKSGFNKVAPVAIKFLQGAMLGQKQAEEEVEKND